MLVMLYVPYTATPNAKPDVPPFDFRAPAGASRPKDTSTAAIMASALAEMHTHDPAQGYASAAQAMLDSLTRSYMWPSGGGACLLKETCDHYQKDGQTRVGSVYGDYYYTEACMRLAGFSTP